ncbi:MAG: hypothetical protein SVW02_00925 [Candidatus Nanohaloarchaea archaeon]|nr:hypothetical protein [Candidatus Nanohaloarchaea archaeon]
MKRDFLRNDDEAREELREALDYLNGEVAEEIRRRKKEVEAGDVDLIPHEDVVEDLDS